jgi:hypothetical protein
VRADRVRYRDMARSGRWSAALLIAIGSAVIALGVFAGLEAIGFMPSLNVYDPPLAEAGVAPAQTSRRLTRRVVLVIVDGLRLDASRTMRSLAALGEAGIYAEATSHYPSLSRPNYVSIVAGVPPQWSGVRSNDYFQPVPLDSAPQRAKAAGFGVTFLSQTASGPRTMFGPYLDHAPILPVDTALEAELVAALAGPHELVAVLIGAVDRAGHAHGAAAPEYTAAVRGVDEMLVRVFARVDLATQTVIVVSDHGHIDSGGHGGLEREVMEVPLVLAGAGIRPRAPLVRAQIIDVAPTVCALLGLPMPQQALGLALVDALTLDLDERDAIRRLDVERHRALNHAMAQVRLQAEDLAWTTRLTRGGLALFVIAALIAATLWARHRKLVVIDLRVLIVAVPAFPLTFYVMAVTLEHMLTPSMVPAAGTLAYQLFRYGVVAAAVQVVVGWIMVAHRSRPEDRVAAAAGLAITGAIVMLVPAAIAWVVAGPPFTARLPGPDVLMLPPTMYAAVACYCLGCVLFVVLEYVAFLRRGRRAGSTTRTVQDVAVA